MAFDFAKWSSNLAGTLTISSWLTLKNVMEGISLTCKSSIDLTCLSFSYSLWRCHQCMVTCGMGYNEKIWLDEFKTHEIVLYVDGIIIIIIIICLFACVKDAAELFTFLNSCHPNIKFTFKKEKGNKIPFLDINKTNHSFLHKCVLEKYVNWFIYHFFWVLLPFPITLD